MADLPDFQRRQLEFAAHIRDPAGAPAPDGIDERRMGIYRGLFFNNLRSLLGTMYPVLKKIHDAERWNGLVREFMQRHRSMTPYFLELPREFLEFLQGGHAVREDDFPFLVELAHYEYIELALSIAEVENDDEDVDPEGDLFSGIPVKSGLAWVYSYRFPVHRISPEFLPSEPSPTPLHLAIYRRSDDSISFLELNAVTASLLSAIEGNDDGESGESLLRALAAEIAYPDIESFLQHGKASMKQLLEREILIGSRQST